jgi:phage terminase large subunit
MEVKIQTNKVFKLTEKAFNSGKNILIHQGGSRAGKTYNILIWIITHCLTDWRNETIDICRKTFPSLRTSAMLDFFNILKENNLYYENLHNKAEHTYHLGTNKVRFMSIDQEQKIRGSKRSILFLNEANEFKEEDFKQLNQRTSKFTILDYNPSDEFHWIYDNLIPREDSAFHITTFLDNPFLEERIKHEIREYKKHDYNYWRIYGLGEKGISETTIFNNWNVTDETFEQAEGQVLLGMDFGFNDPTTLIKTKYSKGVIYFEQLLYKRGLTSDAIVRELDKLREQGKISYTDTITGDSSRPEIINDIKRAGYNIHPTNKKSGSVLKGINFLKMHEIKINQNSIEMIKEFKSYKWKTDKDGKVLDEPVDLNDHACDGARYSVEVKYNQSEFGVGGTSWSN